MENSKIKESFVRVFRERFMNIRFNEIYLKAMMEDLIIADIENLLE